MSSTTPSPVPTLLPRQAATGQALHTGPNSSSLHLPLGATSAAKMETKVHFLETEDLPPPLRNAK
eukprot:3687466-Amphidinium_carterae.1